MRYLKSLFQAVTLTIVVASAARAGTMTFNYDYRFDGTNPIASPVSSSNPWARVALSDLTANSVQFTVTLPNFGTGNFLTALDFNVNPSINLANLSLADISKTGTFNTLTLGKGTPTAGTQNSYHADSDGYYDLQLTFFPGFTTGTTGGMTTGNSYTFKITTSTGTLTANDFNYLSVTGPGSTSTGFYSTAARVNNANVTLGNDWIAPNPEPATVVGLLTMSLGIGGVIAARKVRQRRA